ncbi:MAG: hypothetical protein QHG98_08925 [Methanothrix sp.]|nr:hypothetical protein [Methanothrix sp.]
MRDRKSLQDITGLKLGPGDALDGRVNLLHKSLHSRYEKNNWNMGVKL